MERDDLIAALNNLIEVNKNSAKGFARAQHDVNDEEVADLFETLTARRVAIVESLQEMIEQSGAEPEPGKRPANAVQRGWLNIKAAMTIEREKTDAIVLDDRAQYEADVAKEYEELLGESLPAELAEQLKEQHEQVKAAQRQLAQLKEEKSAVAD